MAKIKVPYLLLRGGRPRWEPGPALRRAGHKGIDLKDERGHWLSEGAAMDRARAINAAIENGTQPGDPAIAAAAAERTLNRLCDLYTGQDANGKTVCRPSPDFANKSPKTKQGYLSHIRKLRAWAGDTDARDITRAAIKDLHEELRTGKGLSTANAVLRVLKILLYFATDDLEWMAKNRAARLKRPQAEGRIVIWTPDEINAAVACADWLTATSRDGTVWDFEGVGDAIIAGALSGQRLGDLIALAPIVEDDGVFQLLQSKTKRTAFVPITAPLRRRRAVMAARRSARWENVTFTHELVAGDGKPYTDAARFNEEFRAVRFCASGLAFAIEDCFRAMANLPQKLRNVPFTPQPGLLGKDFRDLRDTAVTLLYEATGGDIARVATVTGHSLKTAQAIIDKHYFGRNADLARSAGRALDQMLAMKGIGA